MTRLQATFRGISWPTYGTALEVQSKCCSGLCVRIRRRPRSDASHPDHSSTQNFPPHMKNFLTTTAAIESGTGVALLAMPSQLAVLLLGAPLDTPASLTVARVAGIALIALGVICWLTRLEGQSRTARGLLVAMALYNVGVLAILAYGGLSVGLTGIGLWPIVIAHAAMAGWCINGLLRMRVQ